jgi:glycosyltransferase A (GT-A) superfamily protein (DUF2064 family)
VTPINARTILLFTRAPEAEARAKRLPLAEGAALFAGFLKGWQQRAGHLGAELLVVTPRASGSVLARLLPNATIARQSEGPFAERVESAFALAFEAGAKSVLMVGGDSPPLDTDEIVQAFQHLESHDRGLVLTPASDGGVNAIGFNSRAERSLANITWRSSDVCRQLRLQALQRGLALLLTSPGYDLDQASDVGLLYRLSRDEYGWKSFRWLLLLVLLAYRATALVFADPVRWLARDACTTRGPPPLYA